MGTGNNPKFMKKAKKILIKFGYNVKLVRWNKGAKNSIAYGNVALWNKQEGAFALSVGHSAGNFPNGITNAEVRIGINPFATQYLFMDYVLHAKDDWLVIKDRPEIFKPKKELILYPGKHSSFPRKQLKQLIKQLI